MSKPKFIKIYNYLYNISLISSISEFNPVFKWFTFTYNNKEITVHDEDIYNKLLKEIEII